MDAKSGSTQTTEVKNPQMTADEQLITIVLNWKRIQHSDKHKLSFYAWRCLLHTRRNLKQA